MLHILSHLPTIHLISKFNCFKVYLILSFQFHQLISIITDFYSQIFFSSFSSTLTPIIIHFCNNFKSPPSPPLRSTTRIFDIHEC